MDPNRTPRPDRDRHTPGELTPPHRSLMDQFDLPEVVRTRIGDPDDPVDLVRAILEAAGLACEIDGDLIRVGESALVILRTSGGVVIGHEALNHAYLRVVRSGAQRGLVIGLGFWIRERSSDGRCWLHRSSTPGPTGSSAWPMRCRSVLTLSASLSRSPSAPGDPVVSLRGRVVRAERPSGFGISGSGPSTAGRARASPEGSVPERRSVGTAQTRARARKVVIMRT